MAAKMKYSNTSPLRDTPSQRLCLRISIPTCKAGHPPEEAAHHPAHRPRSSARCHHSPHPYPTLLASLCIISRTSSRTSSTRLSSIPARRLASTSSRIRRSQRARPCVICIGAQTLWLIGVTAPSKCLASLRGNHSGPGSGSPPTARTYTPAVSPVQHRLSPLLGAPARG
jgi:hypothetical protein